MKTEVVMRRSILGGEVSQKSKSGFLSATDLIKTGNKWRVVNNMPLFDYQAWLNTKSTKEFISELSETEGTKVILPGKGRGNHTWVHPYIFIDISLAISPKLKVEVYRWLYDELLKYRNYSGDSYKKMCGSLYSRTQSKSTFHRDISKLAKLIQFECGVKDWQTATEAQLKLRDRIQENIALLCEVMNNTKQAIRIAIFKAKES
jgi:hypothetical protein